MMYWIYDIPTWLLGILTVGLFNTLAIGGMLLGRGLLYRYLELSTETNNFVNSLFIT